MRKHGLKCVSAKNVSGTKVGTSMVSVGTLRVELSIEWQTAAFAGVHTLCLPWEFIQEPMLTGSRIRQLFKEVEVSSVLHQPHSACVRSFNDGRYVQEHTLD